MTVTVALASPVYLGTDFDPVTAWTGPILADYQAEGGYMESDIPGTSTSKASMTGLQYLTTGNVSVSQPCGGSYMVIINTNSLGRWGNSTEACNQRSTWTY